MEDQIETICNQLFEQNKANQDIASKIIRNSTIQSIQTDVHILKQNPIKYPKRSIPQIQTLKRMFQTIILLLSMTCSTIIFHSIILLYFGLAPHLTTYTCYSLITNNYAQFDFISTPSLMKGVSCLGLMYTTVMRNQELITQFDRLHNHTLTFNGALSEIYTDTKITIYCLYTGKRQLNDTQLYQDVSLIEEYVQWTIETIWYTMRHSASDSTRTFIKWLNKKTNFIIALRDAFIELPVIRHVRKAVHAIEHTVDHHVFQPIRETVKHGVQCLIDKVTYFGKRLIQWGNTHKIGMETMKSGRINKTAT